MTPVTQETNTELGPIRPPSESTSLLLRVTRNCPWNRCAFCTVYKGQKFSRRTEEEVMADIDLIRASADRVMERAGLADETELGDLSWETCTDILHSPASSETDKRVALWLYRGGQHVFLQDADTLAIPAHRVATILRHLTLRFPRVNRVTTYARSRTLCAKSPDQLQELRAAGLTRIHVGVESGAEEVLDLTEKGAKPKHHIEGCKKAMAAGFQVCCYVMPGLGGQRYTEVHARETARVLKAINPTHVRLRTLWIYAGSPLDEMRNNGVFEQLDEEDIVREIQRMLRGMKDIDGRIVSDHDLNLIGEIEGHLTEDADKLDHLCRQFLDLEPEVRDAFVTARRSGYFRSLSAFLEEPDAFPTFAPMGKELRKLGNGSLVKGIAIRMDRRTI
jgi:radical SAM superfamily enzyme YgiQ (UPF0313 family)